MENPKQMFIDMFDVIINQGNIQACDTYFTDDVLIHDGNLVINGLTELKKDLKERSESIPDYETTVDDVVVADGKTVVRWQAHSMPVKDTGTFKAGEPINYSGLSLLELKDGKVNKVWQYGTGVDIN